jgi:hypothetical protein
VYISKNSNPGHNIGNLSTKRKRIHADLCKKFNAINSKICRPMPFLVAYLHNQYGRYEKNNNMGIVDGWSHDNGGRKQDN